MKKKASEINQLKNLYRSEDLEKEGEGCGITLMLHSEGGCGLTGLSTCAESVCDFIKGERTARQHTGSSFSAGELNNLLIPDYEWRLSCR